jgi:hypothetical protein
MGESSGRPAGRGRLACIVGLAALLAAGAYVLVFRPFAGPPAEAPPPAQPRADGLEGLPIVRWGDRHHFPEIRNPWYVAPDQKEHVPGEDEPVLGLVVGKQARAYSTNQLNEHEMVIDEVGGVPILVTY